MSTEMQSKSKGEKIRCTVEEKILLHLLEMNKYSELWEVPQSVTQEGIAGGIGTLRSAVAREMVKLKPMGLIQERLSHVTGGTRKRKVYFLTDMGLTQATNLKNSLEKREVVIQDPNTGVLKVIKLHKIPRYFNVKISLLDIVRNINANNGIFEKPKGLTISKKVGVKYRKSVGKLPKIFYPTIFPKLRYFFGRKNELKKIKLLMKSKNYKFIIIYGIAGIGKTTLGLKLINDYKKGYNVFLYEIAPQCTLRGLLSSLSKFLIQLNKTSLQSYLKMTRDIEIDEILDNLEDDLRGQKIFIIFDNFERVNKNISDFFKTLIHILMRVDNIKILILTRKKPQFYDRRYVMINKTIGELELKGLDIGSSRKILIQKPFYKKLANTKLEKLFQLTKGHPLALELIESAEEINTQQDFNTFIEEEIFNELNDSEKSAINLASVYRQPVNQEGFYIDEKVNFETLSNLSKRLLLHETSPNKYKTHDLIKEFFYNHLTQDQRRSYHLKASEYYANLEIISHSEFEDHSPIIERIYHLQCANEYNAVAELIIEKGTELINQDNFDFIIMLDNLKINTINPRLRSEIYSLKGDAAIKLGALDKALKYFHGHLKTVRSKIKKKSKLSIDEKHKIADIYTKIGKVWGYKGDWDKTINFHNKSIELYHPKKDEKSIARAYNNIGIGYQNKLELDTALLYFKKALAILDKRKENIGKIISYNNIGRNYELQYNYDEALKYYKYALVLAKRLKYTQGIIRSYNQLGVVLQSQHQWDRALKYFNEALRYGRTTNNYNDLSTTYVNIGDINQYKGFYDEAIEYYNKGLDTIKLLMENSELSQPKSGVLLKGIGFKRILDLVQKDQAVNRFQESLDRFLQPQVKNNIRIAEIYNKMANVQRLSGNWSRALEYHKLVIEILKELGDRSGVAKAYLEIGTDCLNLCDYDDALGSYKNSLKILTKLNETLGIAIAYHNIGKLYIAKGKIDQGLDYYNRSLEISKSHNYVLGLAKAHLDIGLTLRTKNDEDSRIHSTQYLLEAQKLFRQLDDKVSLKLINEVIKT